jgi:2',3'-cyclic-nucleotide 2'-phosphodiesterase/3'-nucleotidase
MLAFAAFAALAFQNPDTTEIVLVATTDLHGQVAAWDYYRGAPAPGGLTRAATAIDSLRQVYPGRLVVVDAGDDIAGSPFAAYFGGVRPEDPHPVIDAMNLVGYDAATPGEAEFAYGLPMMDRALSAATFPFVSGNLRVLPEDTLALRAYRVLVREGVKIGIAGFTTPGVMVWQKDELRNRLHVTPIDAEATAVFRELRRDADVAIVLVHSGMGGASSYDTTGVGPENDAAWFGEGTVRPDLVVVGHSHREMVDSAFGGVHFVQPRPFAGSLAVAHLRVARAQGGWHVVNIRAERVLLDAVAPSSRVERRMAEKQAAVSAWMAQSLGEAAAPMPAASARAEDTPLVRFISDVERRAAGAQLAATPVSDIRAGFNEGEITMAEVQRLYPADYTLKAVKLSGEQLHGYLEQAARYWYVDSAGAVWVNSFVAGSNYDIVGGAEYTVDLSRPAGARITSLTVKGRPVMPTDSFTLALSSFRQSGGGNYAVLAGAPVVYDRGQRIRDLLVAEIRRRRTLDPAAYSGTSWRIVPERSAQAARGLFVVGGAPRAAAPAAAPVAIPVATAVGASIELPEAPVIWGSLRLPAPAGPGGSLLRLTADAYRNAMRADLALVASDEAKADLPAGDVTDAAVSEALPGSQRLLRITMRGEDLRWVFEHVVEGEAPCCEISGATLTYAPAHDSFHRVKSVRFGSGHDLEPRKTYLVAISERLVQGESFLLGGANCSVALGCATAGLLGRWPVERSDSTGADALRAYLHRLPQPVTPPDTPRLLPAR